ncbi:hypothetical protein HNR06_004382 [Nocardiopsis arvandica]|uniref:Uncharacterized protein n=1 Tax=Nocardiopsis sinuspersici TaxID=501010 RepID=A0A7Y9XHT7_9ACTN|nr:hypothetical protein [Nocardiopsis sinuspersici]NYH54793.1 hypothetical protein [Nocardiopsis sinuspersici]
MPPALTRLAATALTGTVLAVLAPVGAHADGTVDRELASTKKALDVYVDEERALADGYLPDGECVEGAEGVMGHHYVRWDRIDRELDARAPEALVYQPDGYGGRELVAVEYFYADEDQDVSTDDDRPRLFGQPFDGPSEPQAPGLPVNYSLHVWLWQENPDGLFSPWNPRGSC